MRREGYIDAYIVKTVPGHKSTNKVSAFMTEHPSEARTCSAKQNQQSRQRLLQICEAYLMRTVPGRGGADEASVTKTEHPSEARTCEFY